MVATTSGMILVAILIEELIETLIEVLKSPSARPFNSGVSDHDASYPLASCCKLFNRFFERFPWPLLR